MNVMMAESEFWYGGFYFKVPNDRMETWPNGWCFWAKLGEVFDERQPGPAVRVTSIQVRELYGETPQEAIAKAEKAVRRAVDLMDRRTITESAQ